MNTLFLEHYNSGLIAIFLIALFLCGLLERNYLNLPRMAFSSWFVGILTISIWIAYPMSVIRVVIGLIIFISGVVYLLIDFRKAVKKSLTKVIENKREEISDGRK